MRVGLEDSFRDGLRQLARNNADQVRRVRKMLEALALDIATPTEARDMLKLKGPKETAF